VCTVEGYEEYEPIAAQFMTPIVVTGFEPVDILEGILMAVRQLESGRAQVENQYARAVKREGNAPALKMVDEVFKVSRRVWRGIGEIPNSGLSLREAYANFDAERRYSFKTGVVAEPAECISGLIMQGIKKPYECSAFGTRCTPERPLGAPMVSSEGACAAYYLYGSRVRTPVPGSAAQ